MPTTVKIALEGVREEHLHRLETAVKTHLARFARKCTVDTGIKKKPEKVPKKDHPWRKGKKRA